MDSQDSATGSAATERDAHPAWEQRRQITVVGLAAGILVLVAVAYWLIEHRFGRGNGESNPPPPAAGTFQPTAQQLKTFTIKPWRPGRSSAKSDAEGRSRSSGSCHAGLFAVLGSDHALNANLGDVVAAGAPLATIEASEFAQGQNDLRSWHRATPSSRGWRKPQARSVRQQGRLAADWQQAQADLAAAEGGAEGRAQPPARFSARAMRRSSSWRAPSTSSPATNIRRRSAAW